MCYNAAMPQIVTIISETDPPQLTISLRDGDCSIELVKAKISNGIIYRDACDGPPNGIFRTFLPGTTHREVTTGHEFEYLHPAIASLALNSK